MIKSEILTEEKFTIIGIVRLIILHCSAIKLVLLELIPFLCGFDEVILKFLNEELFSKK